MIKLTDVGKSFGDHWAVKGLNIEVNKGEIYGFLGPNGAGKTTTIKMISGLLRPGTGRILVGGYDIVEEPIKAKSITGYVPDKGFVYEKLSGLEFLNFIAALYKIGPARAAEKIEELSSKFSLREVLDELVENYSAGMKQRLVFAAALLHDPAVLLIDEPIIGLDPKGIRMLKKMLEGFAMKGVAIFMATHSLLLAEELCSHIGIIHRGRLIAADAKDNLLSGGRRLEDLFLEITEEAPSGSAGVE
ncbi:MAG TPA: ABC transporter ATP-binding protein [Nitrospirae bacterium]|nr:putative ABC transporter ATP-binding protein YbhF [bacterium BMS3Abin10]GBE39988.1 putative ABC transporter ATP-binding protein YbhF [bacterium BMS3Bbin08]HDH50526.1 ABC transporter ATP-binding protein [Nitrospirota bacterium]HDK17381.1 ABC transporter ATP-binding protein [Nitrospirota bacterium]HDK41131.1 ABC transporter ATP-binding protein [Nitrospirota bacterium]